MKNKQIVTGQIDMAYSNILIYGNGDIVGDTLIKLPFIYALRQNNPKAKITWCHGAPNSILTKVLRPLVRKQIDDVVLLEDLERQKFDLVIDTQSKLLITLKLKIKLKYTHFFSPTGGFLFSDFKPAQGYKAPRCLRGKMLSFLDIMGMDTTLPYELDLEKKWQDKAKELLPGKNYIGFAVGAGAKKKCWSRENYQELARSLKQEGYEPVIILGPQEQDWVQEFQENLPEALYPLQDKRVEKQSPLLTIALAQRFKAAISNDCGVGHMFAAADTPLLTLFGPTTAEKFTPKVTKGLVLKAQDFGGDTMADIPQDAVKAKLKELL